MSVVKLHKCKHQAAPVTVETTLPTRKNSLETGSSTPERKLEDTAQPRGRCETDDKHEDRTEGTSAHRTWCSNSWCEAAREQVRLVRERT